MMDRHMKPSHQVDTDSVITIPVIFIRYKLYGSRWDPTHPCGDTGYCGLRRYYKEFWQMCFLGTFSHPESAVPADHEEIYKIYAVILQWKAAEFRAEDYPEGHLLPLGRTEAGCIHSIVRRTGVSQRDVARFVREWLQLNDDVVKDLKHEIAIHPGQNYFT